jgi:hypothetical protein
MSFDLTKALALVHLFFASGFAAIPSRLDALKTALFIAPDDIIAIADLYENPSNIYKVYGGYRSDAKTEKELAAFRAGKTPADVSEEEILARAKELLEANLVKDAKKPIKPAVVASDDKTKYRVNILKPAADTSATHAPAAPDAGTDFQQAA